MKYSWPARVQSALILGQKYAKNEKVKIRDGHVRISSDSESNPNHKFRILISNLKFGRKIKERV